MDALQRFLGPAEPISRIGERDEIEHVDKAL
jgi:hypothetical protein